MSETQQRHGNTVRQTHLNDFALIESSVSDSAGDSLRKETQGTAGLDGLG